MATNINWSDIVSHSKSASLNANINANLNQGYSQSATAGGSANSAESSNYSYNNAWNDSFNDAMSEAWSGTDAGTARAWSALMADVAWQRDMEAMQRQMDFNQTEAEKARQWQAEMANTIYTRSIKNMKEAGINPILAYSMGLSGAGVGSGATASLAGIPSAPLAQSFMDTWSGSSSWEHGESHGGSYGESWGSGSENGSGWNSGWSNSEEGIVTALQGLGQMASGAIAGINAGQMIEKVTGKGQEMVNGLTKGATKAVEAINKGIQTITGNPQSNNGAPTKSNTKNQYIRNIGNGTLRKK